MPKSLVRMLWHQLNDILHHSSFCTRPLVLPRSSSKSDELKNHPDAKFSSGNASQAEIDFRYQPTPAHNQLLYQLIYMSFSRKLPDELRKNFQDFYFLSRELKGEVL